MSEIKKRVDNARAIMEERELDALICTTPESIYYFTDYRTAHFTLRTLLFTVIIPKVGDVTLLVPGIEFNQAKETSPLKNIKKYERSDRSVLADPIKGIINILKSLNLEEAKIGIEMNISAKWFEKIRKSLSRAKFFDARELIESIRAIKSKKEIELLRKACEVSDQAMESAIGMLEEGVSELEVAYKILSITTKLSAESAYWVPSVQTGLRTLSPGYFPEDVKMKKGDIVTVDLGAVYKGYWSNMCRTAIIHKASRKQRRMFNTVLECLETATEAVRPGIKAKELDAIMRKIIVKAGYGDYILHGFGHGIGLNINEGFSLTADGTILKPGMTFTIEPAIYAPKIGGIRLEDVILVTEDGYERLTKCETPLIV